VWEDGEERSGYEPGQTTNQRMELTAAIHALAAVPLEVEVVTDSRYVEGLLALGWKAKVNKDLVERMRRLAAAKTGLSVTWVRGHNGDLLNERADALCSETLAAHGRPRTTVVW
jgi:ribonuclease HI